MADEQKLNERLEALQNRVVELENQGNRIAISNTMRSIVEGTAVVSGEMFFESLLQYLAKALDVDHAFIGEFVDSQNRVRIRTRAVRSLGKVGENFEYDLVGTPCERVLDGNIRHFPDQVQELFPDNELLKALDVRSYLAVPLVDSHKHVIGHLAVMHGKPMAESEANLSIFHIFAARATVELQRLSTESELANSRRLQQKMAAEVDYLRDELRTKDQPKAIVGESQVVKRLLEQVQLVAKTDSTVLILGESGTGKELLAREIHALSRRRNEPLIRVNCAALPEPLIESELFGHEKGAFTGASATRAGRFELADKGTLFLDEIGELPLTGQARLLRVLQEGEIERVGGSRTQYVDVRVLAATNRNLEHMVADGKFREDLYNRLNVVPIVSPALRERRSDIPLLIEHFTQGLRKSLGRPMLALSQELIEQLSSYDWPGNIRELRNVIERAMILSSDDMISKGSPIKQTSNPPTDSFLTLAENEKQHILAALKLCKGIIGGPKGAARLLDVNQNTLRSRMAKLDIRKPDESAQ